MILDGYRRPGDAPAIEHSEQRLEPGGMLVIDGQIDHVGLLMMGWTAIVHRQEPVYQSRVGYPTMAAYAHPLESYIHPLFRMGHRLCQAADPIAVHGRESGVSQLRHEVRKFSDPDSECWQDVSRARRRIPCPSRHRFDSSEGGSLRHHRAFRCREKHTPATDQSARAPQRGTYSHRGT